MLLLKDDTLLDPKQGTVAIHFVQLAIVVAIGYWQLLRELFLLDEGSNDKCAGDDVVILVWI